MRRRLELWIIASLIFLFFIGAVYLLTKVQLNEFVADDFVHIVDAHFFNRIPTWSDLFGPGWSAEGPTWSYRPLVYLTYQLESRFWSLDPGILRIGNMFFHLMNGVILFYIIRTKIRNRSSWSTLVIVLCLGVFLFHPAAMHSVYYCSARSTLMVSALILLTVLLASLKRPFRYFALLSAFFAALTKETGLLALPLALLINWETWREELTSWNLNSKTTRLKGLLTFFVLLIILYLRREPFLAVVSESQEFQHSLIHYIVTQFEALTLYLRLMFWPFGQWAFFHGLKLETNLNSAKVYFSVLTALALLAGLFWRLYKTKSWSARYIVALIVAMLPEFLYPRELIATEQRMYLVLALSTLLFATAVYFWSQNLNSKRRAMVILLFIAVYLSQLYESTGRAKIYSSLGSILKHDLELYPNNIVAMPIHAEWLYHQGELDAAYNGFYRIVRLLEGPAKISQWYQAELNRTFLRLIQVSSSSKAAARGFQDLRSCRELGVEEAWCRAAHATLLIGVARYSDALSILNTLSHSSFVEYQKFLANLGIGNLANAIEAGARISNLYFKDADFVLKYASALETMDKSAAASYLDQYFRFTQSRRVKSVAAIESYYTQLKARRELRHDGK